jgi:hypothetical protein
MYEISPRQAGGIPLNPIRPRRFFALRDTAFAVERQAILDVPADIAHAELVLVSGGFAPQRANAGNLVERRKHPPFQVG